MIIPMQTVATSNLPTIPLSKGGMNKTSWTPGSVPYVASTTAFDEANAALFFDGVRLGVGTTRTGAISASNPLARVKGTGATSATGALDVLDSASTELFAVRDDGQIRVKGTNTGYAYSTAGVLSYDSRLAYINANATLVLTGSNFRCIQSSNPSIIGNGRGNDVANNGEVGRFRTLLTKNLSADDSNIDAVTAFMIKVSAGSGNEDSGYATVSTLNVGVESVCMRFQKTGDVHVARNFAVGDSAITATFGSNGTAVLMLVQGTSPTGNGTGLQLWWDGTNLKYRTPGGTVGNLV